jgi:hypothetical protein
MQKQTKALAKSKKVQPPSQAKAFHHACFCPTRKATLSKNKRSKFSYRTKFINYTLTNLNLIHTFVT